MYKDIKEYKGVEVVHNTKKSKLNGKYNKFSNIIVLYPNFFKLNNIRQTSILEHEYGHHIWHRMPILYRKIWEWISNGKLIKVLNIMGITTYTNNAYVTDYAKTKMTEDWSECIETQYLLKNSPKYKNKRFGNFADTKMQIAKSMYDYFSKK